MTAPKDTPHVPKAHIAALGPPRGPSIQRDSKLSPVPPEQIRRMNLNETPFPPSPRAIEAMREVAGRVNYYPDPKWRDLTAAIAERTGHPEERIVMGHGSDELIVIAGRISLGSGDEVVMPVPSFPGYINCARINDATPVPVPVRQDGASDADAMLAAVTDRTRILFCCTPNNPTGAMLRADEVERLALALPDHVLLIVDEAYHEFAIHAGGENPLPALAKRKGPWAVFRTFSKAYGLAGIRVGYCLAGSDEITTALQHARSTFNVNAVAQAGALAAWNDEAHRESILDRTKVERERIIAGLKALGCDPFPTVGNFVTTETPLPAPEVLQGLERRGIMISMLMAPGYEKYIRITTGTSEDTDALLAALAEVLAGEGDAS